MSAVAMACWPQQMLVTSGEGRGRLAAVGALEGGDVQHLDLCSLAREAVSLLHTTGHVEPTEVQLELPSEPVFARVNPRRMEQVMLHLIADAVSMRREEASATRAVRLSVEPQDDFGDYGPTIQMRYMGRGGVAQHPRDTSSPVGLTVARELVEAQGGHFAVRHHGNTGTTVTVTVELPDQGTASW
jgi:signal transduction histidine kinase